MPAFATLVVTAALASAPFPVYGPHASTPFVEVNMLGDAAGSLSDAIDNAVSAGGSGNGNGNGNGNVGSFNGNNNSGNNNGNNNTGNNNGNNNSGNDNGNNNVGDGFGNGNSTDGNGNNNAAAASASENGTLVTRDLRPGAATSGTQPNEVIECRRVRFLWMSEMRCN